MPKLVLTWFGEQAVVLTGDGQTHVSTHRRTEHGSPGGDGGDERRVAGGWLAARGRGGGRALDAAEGRLAAHRALPPTFPKGRNVPR